MKLKMNIEGKKDFRIPHTEKDRRVRKGEPIEDVNCTEEDVPRLESSSVAMKSSRKLYFGPFSKSAI